MRMFQFIDTYCQDLVDASRKRSQLVDLSEYPHDGFIEDTSGETVPVVFIDGESVPIHDIITLEKNDFLNAWKLPSAGETFDQYISLLEIMDGADAISRIRNSIKAAASEIYEDRELVSCI